MIHTVMNFLEFLTFWFCVCYLGYNFVFWTLPEIILWNVKRKRINKLKGIGFEIPSKINNPHLSIEELKLLRSKENPTDEHVLLYYKMYLKKQDLKDEWTTRQPMLYDEWEENTIRRGGYRFIIPMTCDAMIGFPPNQYYHRYHDYKRMVEEDNKIFLEELENEA